jgi:oligo-1,6-glucosidase
MGPKTWLAVNPNYKEINAASEVGDADSIYNYTRRLIALRHAHKAFVYGDYKDLDPANKTVFAYTRTLGAERFLVVMNYGGDAATFALPAEVKTSALLLSNVGKAEGKGGTLELAPWEARIYSLE